jgi:twitching motility protein PilT
VAEIDQLLTLLKKYEGSDLHITSNLPPRIRVHGAIHPLPFNPLEPEKAKRFLHEIMPPLNAREFDASNDTDFAYDLPGVARFRVNVFCDLNGIGGVLRLIPNEIPPIERLGLPESARKFCDLPSGLILVTGPTGTGKTTTMASMIDQINNSRTDHIVTIEDPIEYVHLSKRCLINQREVRSHTESFARALRAALREDPDIVLVGEMRDLETTRIAIETAETGHLVFATLHTRTAASTIDRLISQFPAVEQEQIRAMTANSLRGIISQTLLKTKTSGRIAAFEILIVNPAVQNTIRERKVHQITSIMQIGARYGMVCLNDSLLRLVLQGVVDPKEVLSRAEDQEDIIKKLQVAGVWPKQPSGADSGQTAPQTSRPVRR